MGQTKSLVRSISRARARPRQPWTNYVLFPDFRSLKRRFFLLGPSIESAKDHWMVGWYPRQSRSLSFNTHRISIHTKQLNFSEYSERQLRKRSMCVCVWSVHITTQSATAFWMRNNLKMTRIQNYGNDNDNGKSISTRWTRTFMLLKMFLRKNVWFVMRLCDQCVIQSRSLTFIANVFAGMNVDICVRMSDSLKTHFNIHTPPSIDYLNAKGGVTRRQCEKFSSLNFPYWMFAQQLKSELLFKTFWMVFFFSLCLSRFLSHWMELGRR